MERKEQALAELKTKKTDASVDQFLAKITPEQKREDARVICDLMKKATRAEPKMWGPSIVGFGSRILKYASGRELDWFLIGFSPRKKDLTLYVPDLTSHDALLSKLGKHKTSKGCLYIRALEDIDLPTLRELIQTAVAEVKKKA